MHVHLPFSLPAIGLSRGPVHVSNGFPTHPPKLVPPRLPALCSCFRSGMVQSDQEVAWNVIPIAEGSEDPLLFLLVPHRRQIPAEKFCERNGVRWPRCVGEVIGVSINRVCDRPCE